MTRMNRKERKEIQLYLQSLSSLCLDDNLEYFFTLYPFGKIRFDLLGKKLIAKKFDKWRIHDSLSLRYKLEWLKDEGWREEFKKIHCFLSAFTEADRHQYIQSFSTDNDDYYTKLCIVNYYMHKLPIEGIAAYDFALYIFLCRTGNAVKYLSNQEAWKLMINAAQHIQKSYSGWNEFITAYACGRQFRESDQSFAFNRNNQSFITKLLAAQKSPIRQIDWNINLELQK